MALKLINSVQIAFQRFEQIIAFALFQRYPPDGFCIATINSDQLTPTTNTKPFSISDILGDGIFWAVPKNRRTIERRLKRKYGSPEYKLKILTPKKHLRVCNKCGHDYEVGILCPNCYKNVMDETHAMQDAIQAELGLNPVEKDVIVLYENEKIDPDSNEFSKNKRIIELKKPRPSWFSKNLLQRSTQAPSTSKDVKPTQLG